MKPTDLLRVALLKTAANLRPPHIAPIKATSSYMPSPAIAPRGPGMAARMKAFDAPMKPVASPAPVAPKPTMPAVVTPRPLGQPGVPAAPPPGLDHGFRPGSPPPMDAMLRRLGVTSEAPMAPVGPQLGARFRDFLTRGTVSPGTAASTAASGALAGVSAVAAKNLADQPAAPAPQPPPQGPVAAPEAEPGLMPDVPMGPRFDPLQGMPA